MLVLVSGTLLAGPARGAAALTVTPSATPAFAGDAPDPDIVYSDGTYFAFTTGTPLGNHIQALVSSTPASGYHSYTGQPYGSTALANPPAWETAQHPDVAGRGLLGRTLADVLRRRSRPYSERQRTRLHLGGGGWGDTVPIGSRSSPIPPPAA